MYAHYGENLTVAQVIEEVEQLETGGTLATLLGLHALRRGYRVRVQSFNLDVLDPSWSDMVRTDLLGKLREQEAHREGRRLLATRAYGDFVEAGGEVAMGELDAATLRRHLRRGRPILAGLSATWLYRCPREISATMQPDDLRGDPQGHFVVLHGYRPETRQVLVADPYRPTPLAEGHRYEVPLERLVTAILLGVITYDAALLVLEPRRRVRSPGTTTPRPKDPSA